MPDLRVCHGGPDGGLPIEWDFSTNANPVPLPDSLIRTVMAADRRRYPDPAYAALRAHLAAQWDARPDDIHPTAGSAEAIRRLTLAAYLNGTRTVWVPQPGYGDYRAAAESLGLAVQTWTTEAALLALVSRHRPGDGPVLCWLCEPSNPAGTRLLDATWSALDAALSAGAPIVLALDLAYVPLDLVSPRPPAYPVVRRCWRLWSPNKALGLTGIRAGAMQAPDGPADPEGGALGAWSSTVAALAPSWVLSAEGVALLMTWHSEPVQHWLTEARRTLSVWSVDQRGWLTEMGWRVHPSCTPFFLAEPPWQADRAPGATASGASSSGLYQDLRRQGIRLRDAGSFGLPGWFRLSVQPPQAQAALQRALSGWHARFGLDNAPSGSTEQRGGT